MVGGVGHLILGFEGESAADRRSQAECCRGKGDGAVGERRRSMWYLAWEVMRVKTPSYDVAPECGVSCLIREAKAVPMSID